MKGMASAPDYYIPPPEGPHPATITAAEPCFSSKGNSQIKVDVTLDATGEVLTDYLGTDGTVKGAGLSKAKFRGLGVVEIDSDQEIPDEVIAAKILGRKTIVELGHENAQKKDDASNTWVNATHFDPVTGNTIQLKRARVIGFRMAQVAAVAPQQHQQVPQQPQYAAPVQQPQYAAPAPQPVPQQYAQAPQQFAQPIAQPPFAQPAPVAAPQYPPQPQYAQQPVQQPPMPQAWQQPQVAPVAGQHPQYAQPAPQYAQHPQYAPPPGIPAPAAMAPVQLAPPAPPGQVPWATAPAAPQQPAEEAKPRRGRPPKAQAEQPQQAQQPLPLPNGQAPQQ